MSYLQHRYFQIKYGEAISELKEIQTGVPQASVLGPILYLLHTGDLPKTEGVMIRTFADDTAIIAAHASPDKATNMLQKSLSEIKAWLKRWRIKVNETKSIYVTFATRSETCPLVKLNGNQISQLDEAKYLGLYLDKRLM